MSRRENLEKKYLDQWSLTKKASAVNLDVLKSWHGYWVVSSMFRVEICMLLLIRKCYIQLWYLTERFRYASTLRPWGIGANFDIHRNPGFAANSGSRNGGQFTLFSGGRVCYATTLKIALNSWGGTFKKKSSKENSRDPWITSCKIIQLIPKLN